MLFKKFFNKHYGKYAYFKLCYGRGTDQLRFFVEIINAIPEVLVILGIVKFNKVQILMQNCPLWVLAVLSFLSLVGYKLFIVYIGHTDLKYKLMSVDVDLSNKYNPQIQKLLRNTRGKK
jgi:long-subunit acyl-CoA synthetase (AMP-forming)